ncbi:MAG TPA: hypothetical protein VLB68_11630 [Pyrinomonadaceae bacterium]|nr:hypothetical protein [Pyrinomonadaceae bacterium]
MLENIIFTLGGVLFGGLITWFYYKRSGNELATEAAQLRRLLTIILNAMEDAAFVKLNRCESGEIKGRVVPLSATFESGSQMFGELQVLQAQKNQQQRSARSTSNRRALSVLRFRRLLEKLCQF